MCSNSRAKAHITSEGRITHAVRITFPQGTHRSKKKNHPNGWFSFWLRGPDLNRFAQRLRLCLHSCGARHLHAAWSAADICRPLCLVVTNYISFVSVLYTKTHSFRCSSSSRKVFWTFREPCYAPFIVHRTQSRVLLRKPVGRRFKLSHNKKNSPSQKERRVFWHVAPI